MAKRCEEILGCYDPISCILLECWRDQIINGSMDLEGSDCWSEEILSVFEARFDELIEYCEFSEDVRKIIKSERPTIVKVAKKYIKRS